MKGGQVDMQQLGTIKQEMEENNDYLTHTNIQATEVKKVDEQNKDHLPQLLNINQDAQLSHKVVYYLDLEEVMLGCKGVQPQNQIEVVGLGIQNQHLRLSTQANQVVVVQV